MPKTYRLTIHFVARDILPNISSLSNLFIGCLRNTFFIHLINSCILIFFQQQQRPDLARLMQIHAQAQAGQLAPGGPAGLPPGLLAGHPGAPAGLPTTMSLLAGIPTTAAPSLAGPHPAFASLLAAQKPTHDPLAIVKSMDMELKRSSADTNGGKITFGYHI